MPKQQRTEAAGSTLTFLRFLTFQGECRAFPYGVATTLADLRWGASRTQTRARTSHLKNTSVRASLNDDSKRKFHVRPI